MISRQHRFHGHTSLDFVYRRGATVRNQQVSLRYILNTRRQTFRVAVIVSRKVHKSAVRRNRIRRRVYEQLRLYEPLIAAPFDLVFTIFTEQVADMPAGQAGAVIASLLVKAGVMAPPDRAAASSHDHVIVTMNREHA